MQHTNWRDLQNSVEEWSRRNFRDQESKKRPGTKLEEIAPFLGLVEELGEHLAAGDYESQQDAVADFVIYMLDFCARSGFDIGECILMGDYKNYEGHTGDLLKDLVINLGRIAHVVLKQHQGIRHYDHNEATIKAAVGNIIRILAKYEQEEHDVELFDLVRSVWENEVQKRDWVSNPEKGLDTDPAPAG